MTKLEAFKQEILADFNQKLDLDSTPTATADGLPKLIIEQV
jgi:hypothetical protein